MSVSVRLQTGAPVLGAVQSRTVANAIGLPLLARNTMSPESAQGVPRVLVGYGAAFGTLPKLPIFFEAPEERSISTFSTRAANGLLRTMTARETATRC